MSHFRHIAVADYPYMVTTVIANRQPVLAKPVHAGMVMEAILHGREMSWWKIMAFVVMPDHLHMIIIPGKKDIHGCIKAVKGYAARLINARIGRQGSLWQPGYFDYILTLEEQIISRIRYIEENPVRKGLVATPEEYPFSSATRVEKMDREF